MTLSPQERTDRLAHAQADRDAATKRAWDRRDETVRAAQVRADQITYKADDELGEELRKISDDFQATVAGIERESAPAATPEPAPAESPEAEAEPIVDPAINDELRELRTFQKLTLKYIEGDSLRHDVAYQIGLHIQRLIDKADAATVAQADAQAQANQEGGYPDGGAT